jgi:thymidine kinase
LSKNTYLTSSGLPVLQYFQKHKLPMMLNEPLIENNSGRGWIEVICGPMFSGKTEELIRRLKRARIANLPIAIFKPEIDKRYHELRIVSHDANYFPSMPLKDSDTILQHYGNAAVVAIDEAQFFDDRLPSVANELALNGVRVIVAGLEKDYQGKPFGVMPEMLAIADYVTKLNAICVVCGRPATYSFRKSSDTSTILLGEKDIYEPRCRWCFYHAG